jgi:hypothetical protein
MFDTCSDLQRPLQAPLEASAEQMAPRKQHQAPAVPPRRLTCCHTKSVNVVPSRPTYKNPRARSERTEVPDFLASGFSQNRAAIVPCKWLLEGRMQNAEAPSQDLCNWRVQCQDSPVTAAIPTTKPSRTSCSIHENICSLPIPSVHM